MAVEPRVSADLGLRSILAAREGLRAMCARRGPAIGDPTAHWPALRLPEEQDDAMMRHGLESGFGWIALRRYRADQTCDVVAHGTTPGSRQTVRTMSAMPRALVGLRISFLCRSSLWAPRFNLRRRIPRDR